MQMAKNILVVQWVKNCLTVLVAISFSVRTLLSCAFISALFVNLHLALSKRLNPSLTNQLHGAELFLRS
jgi:hypothetical protein